MAELSSKQMAEYLKAGLRGLPVEEVTTPNAHSSGLARIIEALNKQAEQEDTGNEQ